MFCLDHNSFTNFWIGTLIDDDVFLVYTQKSELWT